MATAPTRLATERPADTMTVKVDAQITGYLQQIVKTGLYGRTLDEVATQLVMEGVRLCVERDFAEIK